MGRMMACLLGIVLGAGLVTGQEGAVVLDMDAVRHQPGVFGDNKTPAGTVELVPGTIRSANLFSFVEGARAGFFTASVKATPEWNAAQGLSFWVKGDGSQNWGGLEMIDGSDYALRYGYAFPLDSTEWRKIVVPWVDLVPELPAGKPVGEGGYAPAGFANLWFGKWWYWRDYPAHSFAVDQVALEPKVEVDRTDYTPAVGGTPKLLAKLQVGQPVTIVTMGDSLSDKRHWANREVLWSEVLAAKLKDKHGSEVKLVNPAIGGTLLTQNLVQMPIWLRETPAPDLVTVWFGFNDWDSGMRGEHFREMLRFAVDRIRRLTKGQSEIMLMTTCPALGRWDTMEELAEAVRAVAKEKRTGLGDVAAAFHVAGKDEATRPGLYCSDQTHLGAAGHQLAAETVQKAIAGEVVAMPTREKTAFDAGRHEVSPEHPRLFGTRERLEALAKERPLAYERMKAVAQREADDPWAKLVSMALVYAIEGDRQLGRQAVAQAMEIIGGEIRVGHVTFGTDLSICAAVYDLCYDCWTDEQRAACHTYMNKTIDANVGSETHVFHNAWYGYKHWGIGLACYATYYENERAPGYLKTLEEDYLTRAAPALELAGNGGGWTEGYYINYWLYEWLVFCEVARACEGMNYYAAAPGFYQNRAIASMFETFPGVLEYGSRRPMPMGDGGGRLFGGDRDKALYARCILASHYPNDPAHQAVTAFNATTPRSSVGIYAYKDFLWRDPSLPKGDLNAFKLSHYSPAAGYVYARSGWGEDATTFFFKCGDRFTAHQHLDVGHFGIFKGAELAGDGGVYDSFGTNHDVNFHLRTIAHSTMLVYDPEEKWPGIRAGAVTANDGGQHHNWPHHNGAVVDPQEWLKNNNLYDIGEMNAFEDKGDYVVMAGDCTRAYAPKKLDAFVRQIVYVRPGTFVIFDRVVSTDPSAKKTWLLQAMKRPEERDGKLVVTNGTGRLFVQTLLPAKVQTRLVDGEELYNINGVAYPPGRSTGPAPECRVEVTPAAAQPETYFLQVLTATDATVESVEAATLTETDGAVTVKAGGREMVFAKGPGGKVGVR